MIDLTRLMYDDGADRKPVPETSSNVFNWHGRRWRMVIYPAGEHLGRTIHGWWLTSTMNKLAIEEDPERFGRQRNWHPEFPGWRDGPVHVDDTDIPLAEFIPLE